MAQCKGTTKGGTQCKLDAQPDSDFCHLHGTADDETGSGGEGTAEEVFQLEGLVPIVVAGAMLVGMFMVAKTLGKWLPR
jgi:hypothetical protein